MLKVTPSIIKVRSSRQSIETEIAKCISFDVADPTIRNQSSRQNRARREGGVANGKGASRRGLQIYIRQGLHMHGVTTRLTPVESSCFAANMARRQEDMEPEEIVKMIKVEEDDGGDILDELGKEDIRSIYSDLSEEDKRRFRQFRRFHRQYFGVYGEHLPSYHMVRKVVWDLMPGIPSTAADAIAAKRAEILAEDRLRELCRMHGFKFPEKEMQVEAPQAEAAEPSYRFPSLQDEYQMGIGTATKEQIEELVREPLTEDEPAPDTKPRATRAPRRVVPAVIKTEPGEDVKPK